MIYLCIPFALLTLSTLALRSFFKVRFSQALPFVFFSVILLLYLFYIFDVLHFGRIAVISICIVLCFIYCIKIFSDKERLIDFKKQIFSHTFVLYIVVTAIFFVLSSNKFVSRWDCLRLWGAYPKALWSYETLQLGENAMLYPIMQSYPPGMPLLCYFMSSFSKIFDERTLYITYDLFALVLLLPIIDQVTDSAISRGKSRVFVSIFSGFATLIILLIPWYICSEDVDSSPLYVSLFIDSILGIFAGYHLSLCMNKFGQNSFSSICSVLSGACLTLFKDSALLFALGGVIGGIVCSVIKNKNIRKNVILYSVIALSGIMMIWGSWHFLLNKYSVTNHVGLSLFLPDMSALFRFIVNIFKNPATKIDFVFSVVSISLPLAVFLVFFIKILLGIINRKTELKEELADILIQLFCYVFFVIGYFFTFRGGLASYTRYLGSVLLCSIYILEFDLSEKHHELIFSFGSKVKSFFQSSKESRIVSRVISGILCALFAFVCFRQIRDIYTDSGTNLSRAGTVASANALVQVIDNSIPQTDQTTDVYLCIPGGISIVHHLTYFGLIDDHIRVKNFYNQANISSQGLGYSSDDFLQVLIQGNYSYVVFSEIDDVFFNEYKDILGNVSVGDQKLVYCVDSDNNCLTRI